MSSVYTRLGRLQSFKSLSSAARIVFYHLTTNKQLVVVSITSSLALNHVSLERRFPMTVFRKKYLPECSMNVVLGLSCFLTFIWKYAASASMQIHTQQSAPSCCLISSPVGNTGGWSRISCLFSRVKSTTRRSASGNLPGFSTK